MRKQLTVTITGEQGAGKTLLARALARLLENRGLFVLDEEGTWDDTDGHADHVTFEVDDEAREMLAGLGSEIEKSDALTLGTPDCLGNTPPDRALLREYRHTGNGKVYVVTSFVWMGEDDVWGYMHREVGDQFAVALVRPLSHLTGKRANGELRYEAVTTNQDAVPGTAQRRRPIAGTMEAGEE